MYSTSCLLSCRKKDVDARDNPRIKSGDGHDGGEVTDLIGTRSKRGTLKRSALRRALTGDTTMSDAVRNNTAENRFELDVNGHTALAFYGMEPGVIIFLHTEVPQQLSGGGVGSRLVRGALEEVRALRLKVVPKCPFVAAYMGKHPEFSDLLR